LPQLVPSHVSTSSLRWLKPLEVFAENAKNSLVRD